MVIDAHDVSPAARLQADICLAGAGAAGITLAMALAGAGLEVILLESGGETGEAASQALYDGDVADPALHPPASAYRVRRFGGSTVLWGGRCMPFDRSDFAPRPWLGCEGWPVAYDDIAAYYPKANLLCEAGAFAYLAEADFPRIVDGFASEDFRDDALERFSRPTNFAEAYGAELKADPKLRVILHANVTNILCNRQGDAVDALEVKTLAGGRFIVSARHFVLATGGIEVARLLLASNVGNRHDQVGRHYMSHIAGTAAEIHIPDAASRMDHGYRRDADGIYCRRRFALTEAAQRRLKIGNFVARLHHPDIPDADHRTGPLSALFLAQYLMGFEYRSRMMAGHARNAGLWLRHLRNVAFDPVATSKFVWHLLRDRKLAQRKFPSVVVRTRSDRYCFDFHAEQQPNPQSRITLSDRRDQFGMALPRIDWRASPLDIETVRQGLSALARDFAASGCGSVTFDADQAAELALRYGAYGGHHIGTARMSADPRQGVVDADCKLHDLRNLFVAGAATFPTSGQANPTLTIVAMALRLADHLRGEAA